MKIVEKIKNPAHIAKYYVVESDKKATIFMDYY